MTRSVQLEYDYALVEIRSEATELAYQLESPELVHSSLQVVAENEASEWAISMSNVSGYAVDLRPERIQTLEDTLSRRRLMVLGEGGLLLGLLGVCIFMLIRLVATRGAVQREMELFVGQMTHEMKTPLAGLRALLETIQRGRLEGPALQEALALGLRQVEREEHLVQTLLHAQRLRVMPHTMAADPVDMGQLIQGFIDNRSVARPGEPERYEIQSGSVGPALADRDAVWTILENLFDNADKAGASRIQVGLFEEGSRVHIRCTDNGHGFGREGQERLFEPFNSFQQAGHEHKHGTGLGLYISRRLARGMGGELTGQSEGAGQGATFLLELPAVTS